jgi:hypothetical protein
MQINEKYFIFLLGTKESEKSTFFKKITKNSDLNYFQPIGIEKKSKIYPSTNNNIIEINFIDTTISEFNSNFFYSIINVNRSAIILFFNFDNEKSFDYVEKFINDNNKILDEIKFEFEGNEFFFPIFILGIVNGKKEILDKNKIKFLTENKNIFDFQIINLDNLNKEEISNVIIKFFNKKINLYYGKLERKMNVNEECLLF